eukprot:750627-Hanusia_phi.AAC.4
MQPAPSGDFTWLSFPKLEQNGQNDNGDHSEIVELRERLSVVEQYLSTLADARDVQKRDDIKPISFAQVAETLNVSEGPTQDARAGEGKKADSERNSILVRKRICWLVCQEVHEMQHAQLTPDGLSRLRAHGRDLMYDTIALRLLSLEGAGNERLRAASSLLIVSQIVRTDCSGVVDGLKEIQVSLPKRLLWFLSGGLGTSYLLPLPLLSSSPYHPLFFYLLVTKTFRFGCIITGILFIFDSASMVNKPLRATSHTCLQEEVIRSTVAITFIQVGRETCPTTDRQLIAGGRTSMSMCMGPASLEGRKRRLLL